VQVRSCVGSERYKCSVCSDIGRALERLAAAIAKSLATPECLDHQHQQIVTMNLHDCVDGAIFGASIVFAFSDTNEPGNVAH
jgi:hypothetical protein